VVFVCRIGKFAVSTHACAVCVCVCLCNKACLSVRLSKRGIYKNFKHGRVHVFVGLALLYFYMVHIRYFSKGNDQIYGHTRCIYTVLANSMCTCTVLANSMCARSALQKWGWAPRSHKQRVHMCFLLGTSILVCMGVCGCMHTLYFAVNGVDAGEVHVFLARQTN